MLKHLRAQHAQPSLGITVPAGVPAPKNVWLFDFIGALTKARTGKAQGFGYANFAKHSQAKRSKIGNMYIGLWSSCFMNQYFNRTPGFRPPVEAEMFVAEVLAEQLQELSGKEITNVASRTLEMYIGKEYEVTLLTHRGFDPIGGLLELHASVATSSRYRVRSAFAERALLSGGTGATSVVKANASFIKWQSAHGSHVSDKKKELCGRSVALRYSWDQDAYSFIPRPGLRKLILIIDGTWRQQELDALARAGWDAIFYPDELETLPRAIQ